MQANNIAEVKIHPQFQNCIQYVLWSKDSSQTLVYICIGQGRITVCKPIIRTSLYYKRKKNFIKQMVLLISIVSCFIHNQLSKYVTKTCTGVVFCGVHLLIAVPKRFVQWFLSVPPHEITFINIFAFYRVALQNRKHLMHRQNFS